MIRGLTVLIVVLFLVTLFTLHVAAAPVENMTTANSTLFTRDGVERSEAVAPAGFLNDAARAVYNAAKALAWIWAAEPQVSIDQRADVLFDY